MRGWGLGEAREARMFGLAVVSCLLECVIVAAGGVFQVIGRQSERSEGYPLALGTNTLLGPCHTACLVAMMTSEFIFPS